MTDYRPIDCGLHSQYELYCMHRTRLSVSWNDGTDEHLSTGTAADVQTGNAEEYLLLKTDHGDLRIRLDHIRRAEPT